MKKNFNSKIVVGLVCFALGFLANHLFTKMQFHSQVLSNSEREERFPINPDDYDHDKLYDAFRNMQQNMMTDIDKTMQIDMHITGVNRREDERFVYYDIPLNASEKNHELKVSVKDGMISIKEMTAHSESERQFTIDPDLDETKADVQTFKDKVSIKIPKKIK